MRLSGRYRWYRVEAAVLAVMAGVAFASGAFCIVAFGILGGLRAINADPSWWPWVAAGWGMGAIAAFFGTWLVRRVRMTIRCFDYEPDVLKYECVGSRRVYSYLRPEVSKIIRYVRGGRVEWVIVFGDKKPARLSDRVENAAELVNALMADSPTTSLAKRLLSGVIFERQRDTAARSTAVNDNVPTSRDTE